MPFKEDQILIIAPGSQTTLAQLGLPESYTPAVFRMKTRMFPGQEKDKWEPAKIRRVERQPVTNGHDGTDGERKKTRKGSDEETYEEDHDSDEGAVWPIRRGRIVNWSCFLALLQHIYTSHSTTLNTPILIVYQPAWVPSDFERITKFLFGKYQIPGIAFVSSAWANLSALKNTTTGTVVDIGFEKADITAIVDYLPEDLGRGIAVEDCGGEAMTKRLQELLNYRGFNREMCEQLKMSHICEILPPDVPVPGSVESIKVGTDNPAAAASTGVDASGAPRHSNASVPRGPGAGTEVGEEPKIGEDNEGVLDIASAVARGNLNEFLAERERQKAEKAAKKKGSDAAAAAAAKPVRHANSKRERNTFTYVDHALKDALKAMSKRGQSEAERNINQTLNSALAVTKSEEKGDAGADGPATDGTTSTTAEHIVAASEGLKDPTRREIEVGVERFRAASGEVLDRIADAIYRCIQSVPEVSHRQTLWNSILIVGNGSKVRGFKEALIDKLIAKYLISPSSATIFTGSEFPSGFSTPGGTGANTPQPLGYGGAPSGVNPLLFQATAGQQGGLSQVQHIRNDVRPSDVQTPTKIGTLPFPTYFPEWKDHGFEEAAFLGAQVVARTVFLSQLTNSPDKAWLTRSEYNEDGPRAIHQIII